MATRISRTAALILVSIIAIFGSIAGLASPASADSPWETPSAADSPWELDDDSPWELTGDSPWELTGDSPWE
ncbi:hypothetical protein HD597_004830 [Nonomuraea thailandensis]|uniref:Uncharacterized protein n=1 Tax=Nonomuraea thailandensis TaxID=1188745 RepID=A0A9X2GHA9_9ACTN|nr:hypothetical protein [Nonomuraea thailandensis]MCP2357810.1 hypothetical protein [Nonomuraea thailandensis]